MRHAQEIGGVSRKRFMDLVEATRCNEYRIILQLRCICKIPATCIPLGPEMHEVSHSQQRAIVYDEILQIADEMNCHASNNR